MKILNVGLVGYGKMGKVFADEIKKKNNFHLKKILTRKILNRDLLSIKNFFNDKDIDVFIIASPINTHFKYLKYAYSANKDIIIEKPLVENLNQFKKLLTLNKKFKKKIVIHHNDVLNFEKLNFMRDFSNFKKIDKIDMFYGKKEIINSYKKPFFDWLPHPLSIIINFFGEPKKFKIISYVKNIKNSIILEQLKIVFHFKYFKIFLNFSNNLEKPTKKIIVYQKNKSKIYNGYNRNNRRTIKLLLEKFYKMNKINDINLNLKVYKLLFKIENQLLKKSI